jgi:lipopolysaccharide transport system permease protein
MDVKIYTPRREQSFFTLFKEIFQGFREGRHLAWSLFIRDLKAGNRKSVLGYLWIFLPPFATAAIWIFLNGQKVIAIQITPMKYAAFTLCGTLLWSLFAEAMIKPITRLQSAMPMMAKLNFPREAILLACVYDAAFALVVRLILLVPVLWVMGYPPVWQFIPAALAMFGLAFCGLAIGIFISPLGLLYTDIGRGISIVLPFAMYLTPVIYPLRASEGALAFLQGLNPVTPFLERARSLIGTYDFTLQTDLYVWMLVIIFLLLIGLLSLKISLPIIVERSGS